MSETHTEGNGVSFNERVEATAFAGEIRTDIKTIKSDLTQVKDDVRWLRDNVRPAIVIVGGIPTVIALASLWMAMT